MKLYYSSGACSLAPHIAAREAGVAFSLVKVDLTTHKLVEGGADYYAISPRGYVPLLEFDDGSRHTEAAALLQYLGDQDKDHVLLPAYGSKERLTVIEWLTYVSTELHKGFAPLWKKETPEAMRQIVRDNLAKRFAEVDAVLEKNAFLTGANFTVADAYAFTIINWTNFLGLSLNAYPHLQAYMARVAARPAVQEALRAEGLAK
ncbi:MAG: glutathione transferase GstA [Pedobacter sp.]|nr:glutathione transferase GstA [Pedobacter sp.]